MIPPPVRYWITLGTALMCCTQQEMDLLYHAVEGCFLVAEYTSLFIRFKHSFPK